MNILVCVKQVPDSTDISINKATDTIIRSKDNAQINPYDLFALEAALKIKDETGSLVSVMTLGGTEPEQVIKEAYMMGADKGILIEDPAFNGSDVYVTAKILSAAIKIHGPWDLIICGKKSSDSGTSHLPGELGELLGISTLINLRRIIEINESFLVGEVDMDEVLAKVKLKLPCVISVDENISEPRLLSFKRKVESQGREIIKLSLKDLPDNSKETYGLQGSPTKINRFFHPRSEDSTAVNPEEKLISSKASPHQLTRIFPDGVESTKEVWTGASTPLAESIYSKLKELKHL